MKLETTISDLETLRQAQEGALAQIGLRGVCTEYVHAEAYDVRTAIRFMMDNPDLIDRHSPFRVGGDNFYAHFDGGHLTISAKVD